MPGVDFNRLRREITMEQVLNLLSFEPKTWSGAQWYGRCPVHHSDSRRSGAFSVNVGTRRYYCHQCHSHGNQLELWAAARQLPLHQASIDLCRALGREVPWIRSW
jgi:DNA primase